GVRPPAPLRSTCGRTPPHLTNPNNPFHSHSDWTKDRGHVTPTRVLVSPLDSGPTDDIMLVSNVFPGVYDLWTVGLTGSQLKVEVQAGLAELGEMESVAIAQEDFDGDGDLDVGLSPLFSPQFYVGNGDVSFSPGSFLPTLGGSQHAVGFTDVDGDGDPDSVLLVRDFSSWYLDFGINNGAGAFGNVSFEDAPGTYAFEARMIFADVGGQGAVSTFVTGGTGLARSNWPGGSASNELVLAGGYAEVAAADFDGVNGLDLVVCGRGQNGIVVLLNDGTGNFPMTQAYQTGRFPESVVAADLDGDGDIDLAVANRDGDTVTVLCGDGAGGFTNCGKHPVGRGPLDIAAGDVDGNGKIDLVVACSVGGKMTVLLGL
ncbi:MAG: hypothetical protein GC161_09070, partial [Planctomycetaceae bacterium]|nr:hypothetical protein [Planctomycetaceae bacterium]